MKFIQYLKEYLISFRDKSKYNNSISFIINENQEVNFKLDINNYSKESAEKLGSLLFLINEGYYVQSILETLTGIGKDTDKNIFVQKIISTWSGHIQSDNNISDEPIIKPTYFNTATK